MHHVTFACDLAEEGSMNFKHAAVIFAGRRILATGINFSLHEFDSIHAEESALRCLQQCLKGESRREEVT